MLVCDEPTTLLDARNSRHITRLLAALPQQVVMVTHHLHLLDGFDRVIVLDEGAVVADGPAPDALARYDALIGGPS